MSGKDAKKWNTMWTSYYQPQTWNSTSPWHACAWLGPNFWHLPHLCQPLSQSPWPCGNTCWYNVSPYLPGASAAKFFCKQTHRSGHFPTPAPIPSSFSSSPTSGKRCTTRSSSLITTTIRSRCRSCLIPFRDHLQPSHLRLPFFHRRWRLCPFLQPLISALSPVVPAPMHGHGTNGQAKSLKRPLGP